MSKVRVANGPASAILFDLEAPVWEHLSVPALANSLGKIARFNGQTTNGGVKAIGDGFYSVAQHAVLCATMAYRMGYDAETVRHCLQHDDVEMVTGDIVSPLKEAVPELAELCERLEYGYFFQQGLPTCEGEGYAAMKRVDRMMYLVEVGTVFGDAEEVDDADGAEVAAAFRVSEPIIPWPSEVAAKVYQQARKYFSTGITPSLELLPMLVSSANSEQLALVREHVARREAMSATKGDEA